MKWTFTVMGQPHNAEWKQGAMRCTVPQVIEIVDDLIANEEIVMSGSAASLVTASLATESSGWATIHAAVMRVADFDSVEPPVNKAGEIDDVIYDDATEKARQRQFSSRSEAGRYAAQVRWGNRRGGDAADAEAALRAQEDAEIAGLQIAAKEAMERALQTLGSADAMQTNDGFNAYLDSLDSKGNTPKCSTQEEYDRAVGPFVLVPLATGRSEVVVPSKRVMEAEAAKQALGERVMAVAERRTAAARAEHQANGGARIESLVSDAGTLKARETDIRARLKLSEAEEKRHERWPSRLAEQKQETARWEADLAKNRAEQDKVWQQIEKHPDELRRQEAVRIVHGLAPAGARPKIDMALDDKLRDEFQSVIGTTIPASIVRQSKGVELTTSASFGKLGWHQDLGGGRGRINLNPEYVYEKDQDPRRRQTMVRTTMVHEYGHHIQVTNPAARMMDAAYLARRMVRGGNETVTDATKVAFWKGFRSGLSSDAFTRGAMPNAVVGGLGPKHRYAGKRYPDSPQAGGRNLYSLTEALTVGMEMAMTFGQQWGIEKDLSAHAIGTMLVIA